MKKIIIGIDVSKEKCDATAIFVGKGLLEVAKLDYFVFENCPKGFRSMLSWAKKLMSDVLQEEFLFICETTGAYDRALCDYIYSKGLDIWRESALQILMSSGVRRGKDDKADSLMIAEYAAHHMDKMHLYESPDNRILEIRALFLYRRKLEQEKTSKLVRIKELEATAGKSKTLTFILRDAKKSVRQLEKSIKVCEEKIRELMKEDDALQKSYDHLGSVKGLGIVNITALIVYTNNFKAFRTSRKMATYWGVASFRSRSGTSVDKRVDVRNLSSSMLKSYLTQAALHTIAKGGIYHDYYQRKIREGKNHSIALNNTKNKLLHLAMSLVIHDMDYEEKHEFLRTQRNEM